MRVGLVPPCESLVARAEAPGGICGVTVGVQLNARSNFPSNHGILGYREWGWVRRVPEGGSVKPHSLSWNPSVGTWLCGPGKSFSLSEVLFPHLREWFDNVECCGLNVERPSKATCAGLVSEVTAVRGDGIRRSG